MHTYFDSEILSFMTCTWSNNTMVINHDISIMRLQLNARGISRSKTLAQMSFFSIM